MAQRILKLTAKERAALCWLAGDPMADPPHVATLLDLRAFDLVGVLEPTADQCSATLTLTDAGKPYATMPAKRAPRKPKAAAGGKAK